MLGTNLANPMPGGRMFMWRMAQNKGVKLPPKHPVKTISCNLNEGSI